MNKIKLFFQNNTINFKRKTLYIDFLFVYICVWTLITSGAEVQNYLFKFIDSDSSTLYGSAFEEAIAKIPKLNEYIFNNYNILNGYSYLAAILIVASSFFGRSAIQILLICTISSFFFLTITDLAFYTSENLFTSDIIIQSIIANALGSPIIACYIIALFYIKKSIFNLVNTNITIRYVISYFIYFSICLTINILTYYIVSFFYRPTSVNFSVSVSGDLSGNYFPPRNNVRIKNDNINIENDNFSLLGKPTKIEEPINIFGNVESIKSDMNYKETYTLSILPLLNCVDGFSINKNPHNPLVYNKINNFSIKPSEQMSNVSIVKQSGYIKTSDEMVNSFSMKKNKTEQYDITKINMGGMLSYYPSDSKAGFYIATPITEFENNHVKKTIKYEIFLDNVKKIITVDVKRLRSINQNSPIKCNIATYQNNDDNITINADESIYVGLLIMLEKDIKDEFYSFIKKDSNQINITGDLLYFKIDNVSQNNLKANYINNGYLSGFTLHSFDTLSLDGKKIDSNLMDNIIAIGDDIYAYTAQNGSLIIHGKATVFYINRIRQNKTLWELSSESSIILTGLGGLLFSILCFGSRKIARILRKNEKINIF
ncbi:hypothetical protein NFB56_03895 [Yersinia ruckeri]|uniref:hypothetical protein n=3 Tax=Yersinia ruckeri TaxID=29486 RepID=UPI00119E0CC4|nr:hypothetical protein [Yersinia ruckeri]EKN3346195.1 hypothetical protein [Yersinia ruckeri]EKN3361794.1 hypothetical protein [Yersinia ruckeri]EKN4201318.1 hypothetical protein [Yersinia ruckeri]EKN4725950.1 hypothetical protein [Yersinia ruckeri]MCK8562022.1 hypothetical protein [Yersinia ruckeri]